MMPPRSPWVPPPEWHIQTPRLFHPDFETPESAERQDHRRVDTLRRMGRAKCLALADRLDAREVPPTLASSRFMRVARIRILSTAAELLEAKQGLEGLFFVTLVPPGWFVPEKGLRNVDPKELIERLRARLNRAGMADANGMIIGHLEAAYCRQNSTGRLGFAFRVHLVCDENARDVIERLRDVISTKRSSDVHRPLRVDPMGEADLRHVLGYCFMAFWRSRRITEDPEGIDDLQLPRGVRWPDEAACREWLWRDRQRLAHMSIVMGSRGMAPAFRHEWF